MENVVDEIEKEEIEQEEVEQEETLETEQEEQEEELPIFMLADEEDEEEDPDKTAPDWAVKMKDRLKGKVKEKDSEIEKLRSELEELKKGSSGPIRLPKRPDKDDFSSDEEYDAALVKYEQEKTDAIAKSYISQKQREEEAERFNNELARAYDDHIDRSSKLIKSYNINPDLIEKANAKVIDLLERHYPKHGEFNYKSLLNVIGEGSEKAMFYLGTNKKAQDTFESLLIKDKSGMKAAFFLGRETERVSGTTKKTSRAKPPATQLKGDSTPQSERKLRDKLKKAKDAQEIFNIRKEARAAGLDPSKW